MSHLTASKGITLIELLVIVAILGIFSGIGYVSFTSVDTGSNFRTNKETISSYLERIRFKAFSDGKHYNCLLYTSPSPRDATLSRMPSSA